MINTDGKTTIAHPASDQLLREAIAKGGHLGDDVARVILSETPEQRHERMRQELWAEVDRALDPYRNQEGA